jgi:hypothetical protein
MKEQDKNVTSIQSMNATEVTEAPKRQLRAMYVDLDNMYQRHEVPDELKMIMDDMRYAGNEVYTNMTNDLDRMFERHPIPEEVKEMMRNIHGFQKDMQK